MQITNQKDLRKSFWRDFADHPTVTRKRLKNGDYPTDTRCAWVDYIDCMCREGHITEALARRATLDR